MFRMIFRLAKAYLLYRVGKAVLGENGDDTTPRSASRRRPAAGKATRR